jgi:hypothetical protein
VEWSLQGGLGIGHRILLVSLLAHFVLLLQHFAVGPAVLFCSYFRSVDTSSQHSESMFQYTELVVGVQLV